MKIYTIYKAKNLVNNKVYIGFTENWPHRVNGHNYDRRYGEIEHKPFYRAIQKYGWDNFVWEAIYQSKDEEHTLKVMEPYFITEYRSWVGFEDCNGYNVTKGGEGASGYKRTQELIESHRAKMKGRKQTAEHIAKRVASFKANPNVGKHWIGRKHTPEAIEKTRQANLGRKKSAEHVAKMKLMPHNTMRLTCPHCGKEGDYKNMKRWHMDRCKYNLDRNTDLDKLVTCKICNYTAPQSPNFYRNHNQYCKVKP